MRPVIGRFGCAKRSDVASVRGVAVAEWTDIGIAQQRQMGVGVVHPPRAHAGAGFEAEELPRPPERLEALDGFGVVPPMRAPFEGALYLALEVRTQPLRHPGGTVRKARFGWAFLSFGLSRSHSWAPFPTHGSGWSQRTGRAG